MADPLGPEIAFDITVGGLKIPFDTSEIAAHGWIAFIPTITGIISNYCERAQTRLIEQFEIKENINKYLCAIISAFQEIEFVGADLGFQRRLQNATGVNLEGLGDIVGVARPAGATDATYRLVIAFQATLNSSSGEPEILIQLAENLFGSLTAFVEDYPAGVHIYANGPNVPTANDIRQLENAASAGVGITVSWAFPQPFSVQGDIGDPVNPNVGGYAEKNYAPNDAAAGQYTEKIST